MTRLEQSKKFMRRIQEILLRHEGQFVQTTPIDAYVLITYWRIVSLLQGVRLLLGARLPEEAFILSRQMFTDSLQLMEIARRGPDRASLILGELNRTLTEWEDLERQALSLGDRDESDVRVLEHVAKKRKEIEGVRRRKGIGQLGRFRSEKQLATDHGRLDEYIDFEFAHRIVHRLTWRNWDAPPSWMSGPSVLTPITQTKTGWSV